MQRPGGGRPREIEVLFDPGKPEKDLYDALAEQQAELLEINSSQLRRFFGEIKDLFRQFNALIAGISDAEQKENVYRTKIEPRFKLVRSKVAYASRPGGQSTIPREFAQFLEQAISKVNNSVDFARFVTHLEAVVGFMYGKGKVKK
jgi:CRISPR type III-A-associated protein Csm2